MIGRKSAEETKIENDDTDADILDELSLCIKEQFLANDRLGLGRNRLIKRYGDAAPLDAQVAEEALRRATLDGEVTSVIADTGASATCAKQANEQVQLSECGKYS